MFVWERMWLKRCVIRQTKCVALVVGVVVVLVAVAVVVTGSVSPFQLENSAVCMLMGTRSRMASVGSTGGGGNRSGSSRGGSR